MYILGISGGTRQGYQDSSATLLKDDQVCAAVEEERINRVKHSAGLLPERAIRYVLKSQDITMKDVDLIATHGVTWKPDFRDALRRYIVSKFGYCPEIRLVHHHDAHGASAYYASGFDEALVISSDYSGDGTSTQIAIGNGREMKVLERISKPNSLGIYYSVLTQYCGFVRDSDEYKVMGLSSYGEEDAHDLSWFLEHGNGNGYYKLNTDYLNLAPLGQMDPSKQEPLYTEKLIERLGPPRLPDAPMTKYYEDFAASGQALLEDVFVNLVTELHKKTGLRKLCLAGGVALNCVVNQQLMNLDFLDDIYIQPAASDAGISLGAAYLVALEEGIDIKPMADAYLGPEFSNDEIKSALELVNARYMKVDDVASYAAEKVADNKIVGWFQGRMEFGPRALGNRSILGNPTNRDMKDIIYERIKFR